MRRVTVAALSSILAACGGTDSTEPETVGVEGSFSATIDGLDWAPASLDSVENHVRGSYTIVAGFRGGSDYVIDLFLHNIGGPGTYPLGVSHSVFGGDAQLSHAGSALADSTRSMMLASPPGAPTGAWSTNGPGGGGTIEIASDASGRIVGTLTATLIADFGDATGSKTISGTFDFGQF